MRRTAAATVLLTLCAALPAGAADDVRTAVERFVSRLTGLEIRDLVLEQTITLYHPDGLHPTSRGEQRVLIKPPGRQRVEETIEGRREVRIVSGGRTWVRRADGKTFEAPPERDTSHAQLMVPLRRSAEELLGAWRALGIRDDRSHTITVGGRAVTVIGAATGDRESPAVWLDPERGVVRVVRREQLPKGPALVDLAFSEHRPLRGGFQFPHRQEAFVHGRLVLAIDVRSVAVNVDLPDHLFDPDTLRRER
jgi:hypothetical protein